MSESDHSSDVESQRSRFSALEAKLSTGDVDVDLAKEDIEEELELARQLGVCAQGLEVLRACRLLIEVSASVAPARIIQDSELLPLVERTLAVSQVSATRQGINLRRHLSVANIMLGMVIEQNKSLEHDAENKLPDPDTAEVLSRDLTTALTLF